SIEADLLAARHLCFGGDEPAWTDRYVTSLSRLDPSLAPADADAAAGRTRRSSPTSSTSPGRSTGADPRRGTGARRAGRRSAHVAGVAERVATRLRPDSEAV